MRVRVLPSLIFYWLLLVLPGSALRSQAQAPYHVPLGSAAAYGLLSAGSITAQDAAPGIPAVDIPIQVLGKAGASQGINSLVTGTTGTFAQGRGTVPLALNDLQAAQNYCNGFYSSANGQIAPKLDGQTLSGGVYNISGPAPAGPQRLAYYQRRHQHGGYREHYRRLGPARW